MRDFDRQLFRFVFVMALGGGLAAVAAQPERPKIVVHETARADHSGRGLRKRPAGRVGLRGARRRMFAESARLQPMTARPTNPARWQEKKSRCLRLTRARGTETFQRSALCTGLFLSPSAPLSGRLSFARSGFGQPARCAQGLEDVEPASRWFVAVGMDEDDRACGGVRSASRPASFARRAGSDARRARPPSGRGSEISPGKRKNTLGTSPLAISSRSTSRISLLMSTPGTSRKFCPSGKPGR